MKLLSRCFIAGACLTSSLVSASVIPVATYNLNNNLLAEESGVAALQEIDPTNANSFQVENVFGQSETVYRFAGNMSPTEQGGLVLNTTGILDLDNAFSIELVFRFDLNNSSWEPLVNVSNRTSDNGFYVDPNGKLQVYPSAAGSDTVSQDVWHTAILTNNGTTVEGYLDGIFQFDLVSPSMNFDEYTTNNPDRLMHFFVDNLVGAGLNEYASGAVDSIRLFDIALSQTDIDDLNNVPAPMFSAVTILVIGMLGLRKKS